MAENTVRIRAMLDDKVSGKLGKLRDNFDRLGKSKGAATVLQGAGLGLGVSAFNLLGAAAGKAVEFIGDSIQAASNLNEAVTKSQAVFGSSASSIEQWASGAADAFGQSKRQALEAAATFGNLFDSMGLGEDQAVQMSKSVVELASDFASFNNVPVDDALLAIRSGLVGEAEPLRKFGILVSAAAVETKAMEMGLAKAKGELTESAKAQARYALIMEQSTNAQGDFERTSDGLANTQKSLTAQMEDASAEIGEELLPIALDLARAFRDDVIPALKGFGEVLHIVNSGELPKSRDGVSELLHLASGFGPFGSAARLAADDLDRATASMDESTQNIVEGLANKNKEYKTEAEDLAGHLPTALTVAKGKAVSIARRTPTDIADALLEGRTDWQNALQDLQDDATVSLSRTAEIAKLKTLLTSEAMTDGLASADPVVRARWAALNETANTQLSLLTGIVSTTTDKAAKTLASRLKKARPGTKEAADLLKLQVANSLGTLPSSAYGWGAGVGRNFAQGITSKTSAVSNAADNLAEAAGNYLQILSPAKKGPLSGVGPEGWGRNIALSMAKGMTSAAPTITAAASSLAGTLMGSFNGYTWNAAVGPETRAEGLKAGWTNGKWVTINGNPFQTMVPPAGATYSISFNSIAPPTAAEGKRIAEIIGPEIERWLKRSRAA